MSYVMDQQRGLQPGCLVTGVRTPPIRRNSKLASLGRIFKPWKWRKKKTEKLKQTSTGLEKKTAARQHRDEMGRKGAGDQESESACGGNGDGSTTPTQEFSDAEDRDDDPMAPLASTGDDLGSDEDNTSTVRDTTEDVETMGDHSQTEKEDGEEDEDEEEEEEEEAPFVDAPTKPPQCMGPTTPTPSTADRKEELRIETKSERPREPPPPPKRDPNVTLTHTACLPVKLLTRLGSLDGSQSNHVRPGPATLPRNFTLPKDAFRGKILTPTGSPHLGAMHPQLPPSCIIEELHRALATKHRQDSFNGREVRSSPKRRSDGRLSRAASTEKEPCGEGENKKEAEENKENMRLDEYYNDQDSWNDSVISGTLPRRIRKELLAVKLRNRPSKAELEERNIFPARSDQERQEIRQQIEMKLAKRLSQRPAVEELESRNILKQRNDQTEQEERREIKQRLNRKLNQRPTVDELRDRKILIRFSDYVEVAKAQDYDRRADKPWTRLSASDKAAIRKELNEFKSNEMEVHASSRHLTRFHRP
ncbi:phosphatase and actin regulator 3b [Engraulis encrasicolus]|uniref:phosphatase and actin regulator 3b n=1 Tax=Engraulis encrasicolus TaxID=184585 RepID=UPI002FD476AF